METLTSTDELLSHALLSFLQVFGSFLSKAQIGTGTSYVRATSIFKVQMFVRLINFTNLAAQNAGRQGMTKNHPQKSLNNNARSVVRGCPTPHLPKKIRTGGSCSSDKGRKTKDLKETANKTTNNGLATPKGTPIDQKRHIILFLRALPM